MEKRLLVLPLPIPVLAYGETTRRRAAALVVMNHGETLDSKERSFYPMVEFRDAAFWFARRGYFVVVPIRPGFGSSAIDLPDQGVFQHLFRHRRKMHRRRFPPPGHRDCAARPVGYRLRRRSEACGRLRHDRGRSIRRRVGCTGVVEPEIPPAFGPSSRSRQAAAGGSTETQQRLRSGQTRRHGARVRGMTRVPTLSIYTENDTTSDGALAQVLDAYRAGGERRVSSAATERERGPFPGGRPERYSDLVTRREPVSGSASMKGLGDRRAFVSPVATGACDPACRSVRIDVHAIAGRIGPAGDTKTGLSTSSGVPPRGKRNPRHSIHRLAQAVLRGVPAVKCAGQPTPARWIRGRR